MLSKSCNKKSPFNDTIFTAVWHFGVNPPNAAVALTDQETYGYGSD